VAREAVERASPVETAGPNGCRWVTRHFIRSLSLVGTSQVSGGRIGSLRAPVLGPLPRHFDGAAGLLWIVMGRSGFAGHPPYIGKFQPEQTNQNMNDTANSSFTLSRHYGLAGCGFAHGHELCSPDRCAVAISAPVWRGRKPEDSRPAVRYTELETRRSPFWDATYDLRPR
jgi:hypothetical protein